jgi:hypothetical protein
MVQPADIQRLQLWTNPGGREFALKLVNSESRCIFVAATHLGAEYPFLVEEFNCDNASNRGWEKILQEKADEWIASGGVPDVIQSKAEAIGSNATRNFTQIKRSQSIRLKRIKPTLKCHFCCLMYINETDRVEHEKMWHATKLHLLATNAQHIIACQQP